METRAPSPKKGRSTRSGSPVVVKTSPMLSEPHAERSVWVAVRARPLVARERLEGCKACISVNKAAGSVRLGTWRQFSYDHAFGPEAQQQEVYEGCVSSLVSSVLEGYNATVLAYGPTGSGKTHTMGMGNALHSMAEHHGIIPRVIRQLYGAIAAAPPTSTFVVKAQFLEIYNEELRDLLSGMNQSSPSTGLAAVGSGSPSQQRNMAIRECPDGQILVTGAREVAAGSAEDLLRLLDIGTLTRATSGTLLNEQSSRSHAIFSIILEQTITRPCNPSNSSEPTLVPASSTSSSNDQLQTTNEPQTSNDEMLSQQGDADLGQASQMSSTAGSSSNAGDDSTVLDSSVDAGSGIVEYRCSKCHLVDLAGSERASRSGAAGMRFKETVNINQGLLALGNVISALSDGERRPRHVPYRDSKLTRLLQDSLGGNSKTLMIVCVSSADDAVEESLNTLKYAARARSIRNRPVLNRQCLVDGAKGLTMEIQALQLVLLRRFTQQMVGTSSQAVLPEVLLKDAGEAAAAAGSGSPGADVKASHKCLRMLQELQAMAASSWPLELSTDASSSSGQQQRPAAFSAVAQQLADLESKVLSANNHITRLELELDVCAAEQQAVQQAVGVMKEQQTAAWDGVLQALEQLHGTRQLTDVARQQLHDVVQRQKQQAGLERLVDSVVPFQRASLHSHPLPEEQSSSFDQLAGSNSASDSALGAVKAKQQDDAGCTSQGSGAAGVQHEQHGVDLQKLSDLQTQLAEKTALLQLAQVDLSQDEHIFADKVKEITQLQAELAATAERAQRQEVATAARLQHVQADLRRWRARALAVQSAAGDHAQQQQQQHQGLMLPPPPQSPSSSWCAAGQIPPIGQVSLQQEISLATLPTQQRQQQQPQQPHGNAHRTACKAEGGPAARSEKQQPGSEHSCAEQQEGSDASRSLQHLQQDSSTKLSSEVLHSSVHSKAGASDEDQVLFDAELASYISDTDYTDLRSVEFEVDSHLLAELQVVLADKAALEEEKAAAQAEAAAAQRAFEHSRAMLEGQLMQLSSAISSQEALIVTLQANEAEAKNLGALYLERCRELEAQLAELNLDLQELTSALSSVEADAAASADEKQKLRQEYERKIDAVVQQMAGLQQQMKQQDGARVEKERQRASSQVQQLQAELSNMRTQQISLRQRLQERLTAQERDAAVKARELSSLRRAADAAKKRVAELEEENKRQRAALKARSNEAAAAQRQLRELTSRVSPTRSPRTSTLKVPPLPFPRTSGATASPRTPSRTSPRVSPRVSPRRCRSDSPQQQQQQRSAGAGPAATGYAAHYASRAAVQEQRMGSTSPQQQEARGPGNALQKAGAGEATCGANSSSSGSSKQMLTKQVQLLVSEYLAKHRLKQLQAKQEAVQARKDQLLATKAQLELKQLRRGKPQVSGPSRSSSGSSSSSTHEIDSSDRTDQVRLSDLADQLDAADAQQQHLEQLMQKAATEAAAVAEASRQLLKAACSMSKQELHDLLGLALKELALQAAECQETVDQAKRLQVELSEAQQQLHETACCMQMVQLQHQTQIAQLQREHERRVMSLLRQGHQQGTPDAGAQLPEVAGDGAGAVTAGTSAVAAAGVSAALDQVQVEAGAAASDATQPQHTGQRLVGLLSLLAEQGTPEQKQKLQSTLSRLQQLQQAQQQQQQQQHSHLHMEQLQRLKQCRAQQHLRQQKGLLSPRLQQPPQQQEEEQALFVTHNQQQRDAALSTQEQQQQPPQQNQQLAVQKMQQPPQCRPQAVTAGAGVTNDGGNSPSGNSAGADIDSDSDGSASSGSGGSIHSSADLGVDTTVFRHSGNQAATSCAMADPASSLRASASGLQAKLCGYRSPSRPSTSSSSVFVSRARGGSDSSCAQLRSSSSVLVGSPRASLGGPTAGASVLPQLVGAPHSGRFSKDLDGGAQLLGPHSPAKTIVAPAHAIISTAGGVEGCEAGGASHTASMLRKAAQLAMRSSVDATRQSNSGARLSRQQPLSAGDMQQPAGSPVATEALSCSTSSSTGSLAEQFGVPSRNGTRCSNSHRARVGGSSNSSGRDVRSSPRAGTSGVCAEAPAVEGSWTDDEDRQTPIPDGAARISPRSSSRASRGSCSREGSIAGRLCTSPGYVDAHGQSARSPLKLAPCAYQQRHRSSDDCMRPPSLDVSCSSVHHQEGMLHALHGQHLSSNSSSSGSGSTCKAKNFTPGVGPAFASKLPSASAGPRGVGSKDLDALPGSGAASPVKDTSKLLPSPSCHARAAAAASRTIAAAAATAGWSLNSPPAGAPRSPQAIASSAATACRSPYQQFKASAAAAAAAAAAEKDQQSTPGGKSRRGLPASSPSAYMKLLQGMK